jgi:glycosyltransferase involved in cell wall biosynthesis
VAGNTDESTLISVLVPTYEQAAFLPRALKSLQVQQESRWRALVIDDGSPDSTADVVREYLGDPRYSYSRLPANRGLGAALNYGLERAEAPYIAYLPSDDVYYPEHLSSLLTLLEAHGDTVLAYSGVRHHGVVSASGQVEGFPLQLVQVLHRRVDERWIEREELVSDDLDRLFWSRLSHHGGFRGTGALTAEWVEHPRQMHKAIRESSGGLNVFRKRYRVPHPLRFQSSESAMIDEVRLYRRSRERPDTPATPEGLKILLVGELSYNPDRVLALEERGHSLYGLWTPEGYWFNAVGPLPFGHVRELPPDRWRQAIGELKPDLIYALLNFPAVRFACEVLASDLGVPFVWHLKEGPFFCLARGLWRELVELTTRSDGQIYSSPEMHDWFGSVLPGGIDPDRTLILDGDLPKRDWLTERRSPLLSESDGEVHTVITGRPVGIDPEAIGALARLGVHTHFYGTITPGFHEDWIYAAGRLAPSHLHVHPHVSPEHWVEEYSRYDAGWLHLFESDNRGDLRRAGWNDLNYPSRIGTLVAAGLPLIQRANRGSQVATRRLCEENEIGVFFDDWAELTAQLADSGRMARLRENVWRRREQFSFDSHADRLVAFFRKIIAGRGDQVQPGHPPRAKAIT